MSDPLERLRRADPVEFVAYEAGVHDPPPAAVLDHILAAPLEPPAAARRRRARWLVPVVAAAIAVALAVILPDGHGNLVERAYAATAPGRAVIFTETTSVTTTLTTEQRVHTVQWQYRNRLHDVSQTDQGGRRRTVEHDRRPGRLRTLIDGRDLQVGPAPSTDITTVVDAFRAHATRLNDIGETTFNGRRARAYRSGSVTYYIDVETALPLGQRITAPHLLTITTVDRFERLPATAANLAKLDAPAIDAAERHRN